MFSVKMVETNEIDFYTSGDESLLTFQKNEIMKSNNYYTIKKNVIEILYKEVLPKYYKIQLIELMKEAVNYSKPQQPQKPQQPHPILKLTQILDRINDKDYINNYENYAEKCFRYTKSAEGIFINENINGIMQLMINKKGAGTDMKNIIDTYDESLMFYNQKNVSSFNNTLIYDNLYQQYENNTNNLRKIDNMYAFFVVANISKNERIKQKLICNATKNNSGYKKELGWECDEEALAKEKEEALKQQKKAIEEDRDAKEKEKKEAIKKIKTEFKEKKFEEDAMIERLKKSEQPPPTIKKYFNNNENSAKIFLEKFNKEFNKKNEKFDINKYISKLAEALYNEEENQELRQLNIKDKTEVLKKEVSSTYSDDIIQNFKQLDTNGDGKIDIYEFKSAINKALPKEKIDEKSLKNYFNIINTDRSGSITLKEFNEDMKKQSGQKGGGDDRRLYIREMCRTQIALFRELESTINRIVVPDN